LRRYPKKEEGELERGVAPAREFAKLRWCSGVFVTFSSLFVILYIKFPGKPPITCSEVYYRSIFFPQAPDNFSNSFSASTYRQEMGKRFQLWQEITISAMAA
jgi:hypothetical protein